jgi:hypothetical protein
MVMLSAAPKMFSSVHRLQNAVVDVAEVAGFFEGVE